MNVPQHVAIILDGNGRWAKSKGMPREFGHTQGAKNVETIIQDAYDLGIKYVTYYCFSTENWNRPPKEVEKLMGLFRNYMKNAKKRANDNNIRVKVIGERSRLDEDLREAVIRLEEDTKDNDGITMIMAINYGSRDEMVRAMNRAFADKAEGKIEGDLTEEVFAQYLDTAGIPDPDLLIRPSGELRISNYLLWQIAYSELYFTDVPWPAFDKAELIKAIEAYNNRDRRFGKIKEEV